MAEKELITVEKITVSKTYNLGNYQSVRFEMECSVPPVMVEDTQSIPEYYGRCCVALDNAFNANFKPQNK